MPTKTKKSKPTKKLLYTFESYTGADNSKSYKTKEEAVKAVRLYAAKVNPRATKLTRISDTLWLATDDNGYGQAIRLNTTAIFK